MKTNANISNIIMSSSLPTIVIGESGFDKLNSFYKENVLTFKDKPSEASKNVIKKIFGSSVKCVQLPLEWKGVANSPCLVALSFIFLKIVFEDEYLIHTFLDLLENCQTDLQQMFHSNTHFQHFHFNHENFQKLIGEIFLKFNSLKTIFEMGNILEDHYFAIEAFSIFLRMVLTKLKYPNANQMSIRLENTEEIYALLCDYFDLNVIEKNRRSIVEKNGESSENMAKESKIFLFQTQNLFISTIDNEEFCCGNYFQNQTDFLNSKEEIRTSTLELLKNNQDNQDNFLRPLKLEGSQSSFRLSQSDIDMGMSTSVLLGINPENQYFNSNVTTPEFGDLMDSTRFKKNEDFGSIFQTLTPKTLIAVEEDFNDTANSPCSEIGKQNLEDYSFQHLEKEENERDFFKNKMNKELNFGEKMSEFKVFCQREKDSSSPESFNGMSKSKTSNNFTNIKNSQSSKRSLFWRDKKSSNHIKTENEESAAKIMKEELSKHGSKEKRDFSSRKFSVNEKKTETKENIGHSENLAEKYKSFEVRTTKSVKNKIAPMTELSSHLEEYNFSEVNVIQSRTAHRMELVSNIIDLEISRGNPFLKETSRAAKNRNLKNFDFKTTSFMRNKLKDERNKKSLTPLGHLDNSRNHISENEFIKKHANTNNKLLRFSEVTERIENKTISRKEIKTIKFPEFLRNSKCLRNSKSKSIHRNYFKGEKKSKFEKGPSIRIISHSNELGSDKNPESFCLNKRPSENSELIKIKQIKSETDLTDVYQDSHSEMFIENKAKSSLPLSRSRPSPFLQLPSLPDEENSKSFRQSLEHETKRVKQEDRPEIKSQFIHPQAYVFQPFIVPVNNYVNQPFYHPTQPESICLSGKPKRMETNPNVQFTAMSSTVFSTTESPSLHSMLSESYFQNQFYFKN